MIPQTQPQTVNASPVQFPNYLNKLCPENILVTAKREDFEGGDEEEEDDWSRYMYDFSSGMINNNPMMDYGGEDDGGYDGGYYGKRMR
jgi:hypothetical protein